MVNINLLKGKIAERGMTIPEFANRAGFEKSTLYRRFSNNGTDFSISEADRIVKVLTLSETEANILFFNQFVASHAN